MILGMAFPNIIGGIILSPQIKEVLNEYWDRYKSGEMKRYR
jgi:AGCS family alanine or glycine:cation symporter